MTAQVQYTTFLGREMKIDMANFSQNPDELAALAVDKDSSVRSAVARNHRTPNRVLFKMLTDRSHANGRTSIPFYIKKNKGANPLVRMLAKFRFDHTQ